MYNTGYITAIEQSATSRRIPVQEITGLSEDELRLNTISWESRFIQVRNNMQLSVVVVVVNF